MKKKIIKVKKDGIVSLEELGVTTKEVVYYKLSPLKDKVIKITFYDKNRKRIRHLNDR